MEITIASVLITIVLLVAFRKPIKGIFNWVNTVAEPATFASSEMVKANCAKSLLKSQKQNFVTQEDMKKSKTVTGDDILKQMGFTSSDS